MTNILRKLRRDETGGALLAIGYAVIAVAIIAGLTTISITSNATAIGQRIAQAADAGLRSAVDTVVAEINVGGSESISQKVAALEGRTFDVGDVAAIQTRTTIDRATFDGVTVRLDLTLESTGRMSWTRKGSAALRLAYATRLADIADGRPLWDYELTHGIGTHSDFVVALWLPAEMIVYSENADETLTAPTQPVIEHTLDANGEALFTASPGVCQNASIPALQIRYQLGGASWSGWLHAASAQGHLSRGQQATFEARSRCEIGENRYSPWSLSVASILRSLDTPEAPQIDAEDFGTGIVTFTAVNVHTPADEVIVRTQVRVRELGKTWSPWTDNAIAVANSGGQQFEAQSRIRIQAPSGDTGWIESDVESWD